MVRAHDGEAAPHQRQGARGALLQTSQLLTTVKLYGLERSVYTRIARLALEEKGVPYTLHEAEIFGPEGVPAQHRTRHPFGRIPALEHDGLQLYETGAITRYVDEAFAGPPLQPREPVQRARMNQIISVIDAYAYRPMVWGVFVERVGKPLRGQLPDEAKIAESMAASQLCLGALAALVECTPHLVSSELTLADLHAYPVLRTLCLAPEGQALLRRHDALPRWLEVMQTRASVRRTVSRYEPPAPDVQSQPA
jgi:glutathione S-transferase